MKPSIRSTVGIWCGVIAAVGAISIANAQATPKSALLVLSKRDQTLAIVDPDT